MLFKNVFFAFGVVFVRWCFFCGVFLFDVFVVLVLLIVVWGV